MPLLTVDFNILRRNLKTLRAAKGMSAKDLSIECNFRQQKRIADIEDGRGSPSIDEVYTLSIILGKKIDDLLFHEFKLTVS